MRTQTTGRNTEAHGRRQPPTPARDGGDTFEGDGADGASHAALEAAVRRLTQDQMLVNQALVERLLAYEQADAALRDSEKKLHELLVHQTADREAERKRISCEIHNSLGQNLLALRIDIVMLYQHTATRGGRLHDWVGAALDNVDTTLRTVKQLMGDLRPSGLELGLQATLEMEVRKFTRASGIACQLDSAAVANLELEDGTVLTVYHVLQECLNNVFRHSLASRVLVSLAVTGEALGMTVADNGIGFDPDAPRKSSSYGLFGLEQRMAAHGGDLAVASGKTQGTTVSMRLPFTPSQNGAGVPAIG